MAAVAGTSHRRTAEERRAQVLEAAIHEFAVHGLYGATTAAIAARANISQPYLFALFGDKKALFLAAQDHAGDDVRAALTQACRTATPGEPPAITVQRYRRLLTCPDSLRCQLQGYAAAADPQIRAHMRRGHRQITDLARRLTGAPGSSAARLIAISLLLTVNEILELPALTADPSPGEARIPHTTLHRLSRSTVRLAGFPEDAAAYRIGDQHAART